MIGRVRVQVILFLLLIALAITVYLSRRALQVIEAQNEVEQGDLIRRYEYDEFTENNGLVIGTPLDEI